MTDKEIVEKLTEFSSVNWHLPPSVVGVCLDAADLIEEYNQLFDLQHRRSVEADKLWREAHPGNDLVVPDLGNLLTWMLGEVEQLRDKLSDLRLASEGYFNESERLFAEVVRLRSLLREIRETDNNFKITLPQRLLTAIDAELNRGPCAHDRWVTEVESGDQIQRDVGPLQPIPTYSVFCASCHITADNVQP